jgi:hypothetical protein
MSEIAHAQSSVPPLPSDEEGFAFLDGEWNVSHRKLKEPLTGRIAWNEFTGTAKFVTLLDGLMSVEDLRNDKGVPFGGAVRLFDRKKRTWSDQWVPFSTGVLQGAQHGSFKDGVGTFESDDEWNGKPIRVRGTWKRVNKNEVTWEQAASTDGGKTWEVNWSMRFVRTPSK